MREIFVSRHFFLCELPLKGHTLSLVGLRNTIRKLERALRVTLIKLTHEEAAKCSTMGTHGHWTPCEDTAKVISKCLSHKMLFKSLFFAKPNHSLLNKLSGRITNFISTFCWSSQLFHYFGIISTHGWFQFATSSMAWPIISIFRHCYGTANKSGHQGIITRSGSYPRFPDPVFTKHASYSYPKFQYLKRVDDGVSKRVAVVEQLSKVN